MLYDIITELAQELGRELSNSADRLWLVQQINHAARELYGTNDIRGCEWEKVFNVGTTDQQIALPWYVQEIIAVRDYDTRVNVQQVDMRPRYARSGWKKPYLQEPYLQWRQKGDSALQRNLNDEAAITLSLPSGCAATAAMTLYVTGSNEQSSRVVEAVQFAVGDTTKTTTNFFSDIKSIRRGALTSTYDLLVTDIEGNEIAMLPNNQQQTRYSLVQILDRDEVNNEARLVEVLYKKRFEPMVVDTDTFSSGDTYDKVIYWKTLELILAKQDGKEDKAAMCGNKAAALLANIISSDSGSIEMMVDFGRNPTLNALDTEGRRAMVGTNYYNRY